MEVLLIKFGTSRVVVLPDVGAASSASLWIAAHEVFCVDLVLRALLARIAVFVPCSAINELVARSPRKAGTVTNHAEP